MYGHREREKITYLTNVKEETGRYLSDYLIHGARNLTRRLHKRPEQSWCISWERLQMLHDDMQ